VEKEKQGKPPAAQDAAIAGLDSGDQELIRIMREAAACPSSLNLNEIDKVLSNWKKRPDVKKSIEEKKDYMRS